MLPKLCYVLVTFICERRFSSRRRFCQMRVMSCILGRQARKALIYEFMIKMRQIMLDNLKKCIIIQLQKLRSKLMLKRRSASKNKKVQLQHLHSQGEKHYNHLLKLTSSILTPKLNAPHKVSQVTKTTKSSNITPSTKSRKQSKENLYHAVFTSNKSSTSTTAFQHFEEKPKLKTRNDYYFQHQVGSGGFGRVWKVKEKCNDREYAMKEMSKAKVIMKKSINSVINEKQLLEELRNPFIINVHNAFQDRENLYLVMEYLKGGDLRYHMCFYEYFDEDQTKFIVACIVQALEYIHSCNVLHRDLKPENIVFEDNGYVHITDFGVARKYRDNNADETSGTPGYMAPEVICRMNHSFQVDFFALGVIMYEMMLGVRPYLGNSRKEIRQKIISHQVKLNDNEIPHGWNQSCADFVNRLLKRNKENRLGFGGISEIKNHPWLKSINWIKLQKKQIIPPFIPGVVSESQQYQHQMQNSCQSDVNEQTKMLLKSEEVQKLFKNYEVKKKYKTVKGSKKIYIY